MSSAYHPQTDGQTERLNQVVEQLLRTACKDDVSHWDTQLPALEFAYNNASHAARGKTPFFLCYGREPLTPQQPTTPAHVQAAHDFVTTMQQLWEKTQRRLTTMQTSQKQYADRQRRDHSVAVGDQVLLDTRNLNLSHLPSKLRPRFCGPFLVEAQVTPVTFRLRLPDTWKLHNAFHVQLLKPYKDPNQQFQGRQLPPPPPVLIQDEPEYKVERVLTHRRRGGKTLEFLLRWKGYDPTEDSWVAEADMGNARRALKDYLAAMDVEMASSKSTGTYVDEVPPPGANIVDGMWIFRVKRPPGSPPAFKARYITRGFSASRVARDTLRTTLAALGFAPATADLSLFLRTDTSLPPFYVLVYDDDLVFATADTEALTLVKLELQKRHTCTDLGELRSYLGLQITRDRARRTITQTQSHMVHQVPQRFGFQFSLPQPTPLSSSHSLSAPPSDESVEPSGPYPELVGCLMYLMTCTRPNLAYPLSLLARYVAPGRHQKVHWDAAKRVLRYLCSTSGMGLVLGGRGPVVLTGHADASWVDDSATQQSSQGYPFSLGSGSVSWQSTRSSSVLSSSCEAEIYAGAMAAQERWLAYLLTDLGEQPRSPPVLYVDNKAMIALCQEHRLEHNTKHIALRYFLARELQQHGQLRLAYAATQANTADVFTKALLPGPCPAVQREFRHRVPLRRSSRELEGVLEWSANADRGQR
ncbi:unnamed protein product [Closterium sp. NIES-54]